MTLTVSMAYYGCPHEVQRAVDSVLAQTHRDLRLVLIGDGQRPPVHSADPRLTVVTLPENRGPYYCDAVVLAACDTEWFSIHAADDWSEPRRFARLLAATDGVDAVFGGSVEHTLYGQVHRRPTHFTELTDNLRHVGSIATAVVRTEAMRSVGGPHPEFRVAYDTMLVHLILRGLSWRHLRDEFGYHRVLRRGSLTLDPVTGLKSEYRRAFWRKREPLWRAVIAAPQSEWPRILEPSQEVAERLIADSDRVRIALRAVAA